MHNFMKVFKMQYGHIEVSDDRFIIVKLTVICPYRSAIGGHRAEKLQMVYEHCPHAITMYICTS